MRKRSLGRIGEDLTRDYLFKKGWKILFRNYKLKIGELDLVAKDPKGMLVFIEVKTGQWPIKISPEDNFTNHKAYKFARMCRMFSAKHPELFDPEKGWRMDLITVVISREKKGLLRHYKNI